MGLIEWYVTFNLKKYQVRFPAYYYIGRKTFNSLSKNERDLLTLEWREYNSSKDLGGSKKKELREPVENRTSPLMFEGQEIPGDIHSMDEVKMFLDLPKGEKKKMLEAWKNRSSSPQTLSSLVEPISGVQIPLFRSSKIKILLEAIRKYSNVR
jgi:hypothetical protein